MSDITNPPHPPSGHVDPGALIIDLARLPDETFPIWPGAAPGGEHVTVVEELVSRENEYGLDDHAYHNITAPIIGFFKAASPNGAAILIAPGGGYVRVVREKDGWEVARWFNAQGYHVYVMNYRLPNQGWSAGPDTPLQDAQRALRLVRSRAVADGVNPNKIAVMGASAGGHLMASLSTRFDVDTKVIHDEIDGLSARPDASILLYPVITMEEPYVHAGSRHSLIGDGADGAQRAKYSPNINPPANSAPTIILHANDDDAVPVENAIMLHQGLRAAGVPCSMHIYDTGGHGFGMRGIDKTPTGLWPAAVVSWLGFHNIK